MARYYCHYQLLEEYHAGMWRKVSSEVTKLNLIAQAVAHFRNIQDFKDSCLSVITHWRHSCLTAFTTPSLNKIAWIGQAAVCQKHRVPEDLTRRAWWKLTEEQRDSCNEVAAEALASWRYNHYGVDTKKEAC